jgi:beta-lactamase regulating signal transducer with metallopeptidase domain
MNLLRTLVVESPAVHRLGWTLLHSIWEGLVIAILLAVALAVMRRRSAQARYLVSCGAMIALAVTPVATFFLLTAAPRTARTPAPVQVRTDVVILPSPAPPVIQPPPSTPSEAVQPRPEEPAPVAAEAAAQPTRLEGVPTKAPAKSGPGIASRATLTAPPLESAKQPTAAPSLAQRARDGLSRAAPWVVLAWLIGVLGLSVRNAGAWLAVQHLKSMSTGPVGPSVVGVAERLGKRLGVRRAVRLLQSARVDSPLVIGIVKPLILLPAAVLTELPPAHLEALLAHELAHVLRHDYLVNLLQSVIETLLFYHPATWWVSRRIRAERENCCDDLALAVTRDRVAYARALAVVAGAWTPALAPAASGGDLLPRLRRVLGKSDTAAAGSASRWLVGALAGGLCVAALLMTRLQPPAHAAAPADSERTTRPGASPSTRSSSPSE